MNLTRDEGRKEDWEKNINYDASEREKYVNLEWQKWLKATLSMMML